MFPGRSLEWLAIATMLSYGLARRFLLGRKTLFDFVVELTQSCDDFLHATGLILEETGKSDDVSFLLVGGVGRRCEGESRSGSDGMKSVSSF